MMLVTFSMYKSFEITTNIRCLSIAFRRHKMRLTWLNWLKPQSTSKEQEEACRNFYFVPNKKQANWGIIMFYLPIFCFII